MDESRGHAEVALGLLFAGGAVFNVTYIKIHGARFWGSWADGAAPNGESTRSA